MSISNRSRWNRSTLLRVYDASGALVRRPYLTRVKPLLRVNFPDNREYTLVAGDTWSNIAFRFLGESYLWWVICDFNRVVNPWDEIRLGIEEGRVIVIPSLSRVNFDVLTFGRSRSR